MTPKDAPAHPSRPVPRSVPAGNGAPIKPYTYRGTQPWRPKGKT